MEQRRYLVRSTNSGISAFVDPVGRVVAHTRPFEMEALAHEIAWLHASTPFELWGNGPWWLVTAASVYFAFARRKPRPES